MRTHITIGTRGSKLALWQAEWVKTALLENNPAVSVELSVIKTKGDKILDVPLAKVGGKGLFVKEIEEALLDGRVDLAVHSMKDMPSDLPEGLAIGAVPLRETPFDVLISNGNVSLKDLPEGACVGTSSLRRAAQLLNIRPDIRIIALRGNLDTRIAKLQSGDMDAIILAAAGVKRLGYQDRISEVLPPDAMLPAVGQGALCIETRDGDTEIRPLLAPLEHPDTRTAVTGERAFLHRLEGGCQVPIAAYGQVNAGNLNLTGLVADLAGRDILKKQTDGPAAEAAEMGIALAEELLAQGAGELLEHLKSSHSASDQLKSTSH